jgi:aspartyl-tRNA(Asn)/glutamyl-tRNA(Gln) amidotransferase subunit C
MSVSLDDVRHVAALARIGVTDERAAELVSELNTILQHMEVLSSVDTNGVELASSATESTLLRDDTGPAIPLAQPRETFAPKTRNGFFLVPRLDTHEDVGMES